MEYVSTRGGIKPISFSQAVTTGLAEDGGLILPKRLPQLDESTLKKWRSLSYEELCFEVFKLFVDDIPQKDLKRLIRASYSSFRHEEVTPVVKKGRFWILELFHGPTFAFKDVALQFLGNLFEYLLERSQRVLNILGATSGDTGSAAIYGVKGKKNMTIFILHPHERVSRIQALQMTTVEDPNVFNLAVRGTFDDCQAIVKTLFSDTSFKNKYHLGAVNSINWARILAQVVYYVWAWLRVTEREGVESVRFSVPTGNFGDIFAGYVAKRLLGNSKIERLILATNENDILTRFVNRGDYSVREVIPTISPSMDIQVASNFERYLYYLFGESPERVREAMETFSRTKRLEFDEALLKKVRKDFLSRSVSQQETLKTIYEFYEDTGYVLDPHTAVGVRAAMEFFEEGIPTVCLATAHPSKFPEAVERALGFVPEFPPEIKALFDKKRRYWVVSASVDEVREFVESHALKGV